MNRRDDDITAPLLDRLRKLECPTSFADVIGAMEATDAISPMRSFERLEEALERFPRFIGECVPRIWHWAVEASSELPAIPLLDETGVVTLTQRECLIVLSNAFLCTYAGRVSDDCLSGDRLPSINFDELYGGHGWGNVEVEKLMMLLSYFEQMCQRDEAGDALDRRIGFHRRRASESSTENWGQCEQLLRPVSVAELGESLDDAKSMYRVDFANRIIGGAAIAFGNVQEEIMFCECPEMIVARLFCPAMRDDEAIVIVGAEQFTQHSGYAGSLRYEGRYRDQSEISDGQLQSYVVALDALDLRGRNPQSQYDSSLIQRDLTKAWAGFDEPGTPEVVATGNWGCGVFGGDAELKTLIQWLACSRVGKAMAYFPYDHRGLAKRLGPLANALIEQRVTVGQLARFLFQTLEPNDVFDQVAREFGMQNLNG